MNNVQVQEVDIELEDCIHSICGVFVHLLGEWGSVSTVEYPLACAYLPVPQTMATCEQDTDSKWENIVVGLGEGNHISVRACYDTVDHPCRQM